VRLRHHARLAGAHSDSTSGVRVPCCAQARGFPRGTRIKSDNADPLFQWGMGVQQVALNLQTNDTPTQLHHALFALGGGCGYVLKPREMRAEPPEACES